MVYTSHEGTTHLYNGGISLGVQQFLCPVQDQTCYLNHVNIWYSTDQGKSWVVVPPQDQGPVYSGFSDPDLTEDEGGNIYDTGIDLANDALFSSSDGGKTWPNGTIQCHDGDRPWLAGGKSGHAFLATNAVTGGLGHTIYRSVDKGNSCSPNGLSDPGGDGKLYYDHVDGSLVEPVLVRDQPFRLGVGYLPRAEQAFDNGNGKFQRILATPATTFFSHWPAIALDSAENLYEVWDTDDRAAGTSGGCGGSPTPLPNKVLMVVGTHTGPGAWSWSAPITVAAPQAARVYWPWVQAGDPGSVSVVWYQTDKLDDLDCDQYKGQKVNEKTTIYAAQIFKAGDSASRTISTVNASGRVIHIGGVCQGGTSCVVTGQDRRLGDFFTNALDQNGCVLIASGDTMLKDQLGQELITSRPIFFKQNSGPSLTGRDCATGQRVLAATTSTPGPLPNTRPAGRDDRSLILLPLALLVAIGLGLKASPTAPDPDSQG